MWLQSQRFHGVGLNEHSMAKKENRCAQKSNKSIHGYILDICVCDCSPGIVSVETKEMQWKIIILIFFILKNYVLKLAGPSLA